jgi:Cdc6-like AAA superfamily ATPase
VEFLDQSGLRDFLDTKADGQYLRQVHPRIAADRLSAALLHDLSARNLQQYRAEMRIGSSRAVIQTVPSQTTATFLGERSVSLVLVAGPSGSGKTVQSDR